MSKRVLLKRVIKYSLLSLVTVFLLFYGVLAAFIWYSDLTYRTDRALNKSIHNREVKPHQVSLIDDGLTSLVKRIELLRAAKKSIEMEFFIYELDFASQLFTFELIEAAKRGIRVRLLVDFAAPVFKLAPLYATFMQQHGIEVKYYNTSPAYSFINMQHRNHRKLLLVDKRQAITGGRNIGNDYFNLSPRYNFLDADVSIEGPIVKAISRSFELYWSSRFTTKPQQSTTDTNQVAEALGFFTRNQKVGEALARLDRLAAKNMFTTRSHTCQDIEYVTDLPGVTHDYRRVFQVLSRILKRAQTSLVGETPYFVIRPGGLELLNFLKAKKINTSILTNGLRATDAWYTITALDATLDDLKDTSLHLQAYNGKPPKEFRSLDGLMPSKRWGVHAKRAVIDQKTTIIGTYNIDPRSANLNSELLIICHRGQSLAQEMQESIKKRMQNSLEVLKDGRADPDNLFADADFADRLLTRLAKPLVVLFDFLL